MPPGFKLPSVLAIGIAGILSLVGCGSGNSGSTTIGSSSSASSSSTPGAVTVYPGATGAPVSVPVNGKVQFSAFLPSQPSSAFTWSVTGGGSITSAGIYTAPATIPSPASVTVTATSSANTTLTGTSTVNITPSQGVAVIPSALAIQAGATQTFTATVNGAAVTPTWEVNNIPGGDSVHGTIDANGNYKAPLTPPPGGSTTILAVSGTGSATVSGNAAVTVEFSTNSLNGPYAFSYTGDDSSGFLGVSGSFTAVGSTGQIQNGVEDGVDFGSSATEVKFSGTFSIGPDGRASATLSDGSSWQFTLVSSPLGGAARQAELVRFDTKGTGSGTINAQSTALLAASAFSGNYVFGLSGLDEKIVKNGNSLVIAGRFYADGVGTIPSGSAVQDINDGGTSTFSATATTTTTTTVSTSTAAGDTTLQGAFLMDATLPNSGRGTISLSSNNTIFGTAGVTLQFAFYIVDNTHLKVIEIDNKAALTGDFFSAVNTPTDGLFIASSLPSGNYVFTAGGSSNNGAYAVGGVFTSNGGGAAPTNTSGTISGGVIDVNNGPGDVVLNRTLSGSSYSVNAGFGRITLPLTVNNQTANFVGYMAGYNSPTGPVTLIELIEVDTDIVASGIAIPQTSASSGSLLGSYGLNISGVANISSNGAVEQDITGQVTTAGALFSGTLDINNFALTTTTPRVPVVPGTSTIVAPVSSGRGTAAIATSVAVFNLSYYIASNNTVLLLEADGGRVATGVMLSQF